MKILTNSNLFGLWSSGLTIIAFPFLQFVSSKLGKLNLWHWTNRFVHPDFGWNRYYILNCKVQDQGLPWKEPHILMFCDPEWRWCCILEACQKSWHCIVHTKLTECFINLWECENTIMGCSYTPDHKKRHLLKSLLLKMNTKYWTK